MQQQARLFIRFTALLYDSLILMAIFFVATAFYMLFSNLQLIPPAERLYQVYLIGVWLCFVTFFWRRGGQTTGMAAWQIRLQTIDGGKLSLKLAIYRGLLQLMTFPVALLWAIVDTDNRLLFDRLAGTMVVSTKLPKQ